MKNVAVGIVTWGKHYFMPSQANNQVPLHAKSRDVQRFAALRCKISRLPRQWLDVRNPVRINQPTLQCEGKSEAGQPLSRLAPKGAEQQPE